jgi:hypothetical protein
MTGLPRPYRLALDRQFAENAFPIALFAQRWILAMINAEIQALPMPSIEEHDDL